MRACGSFGSCANVAAFVAPLLLAVGACGGDGDSGGGGGSDAAPGGSDAAPGGDGGGPGDAAPLDAGAGLGQLTINGASEPITSATAAFTVVSFDYGTLDVVAETASYRLVWQVGVQDQNPPGVGTYTSASGALECDLFTGQVRYPAITCTSRLTRIDGPGGLVVIQDVTGAFADGGSKTASFELTAGTISVTRDADQ